MRFFFDLRQAGLRDLLGVGNKKIRKALVSLNPHVHGPERLELALVMEGHQTQVVNGRRYEVRANEGLLILPGDTHGDVNTAQAPSTVCFVILRARKDEPAFLNLKGDDALRLRDALSNLSPRQFRVSPGAKELFNHMVALLWIRQQAAVGDGLLDTAILSATAAFLAEIALNASKAAKPRPSPWIEAVRRHIEDNMSKRLSVGVLAKVAGASPSHFMARFKRETGLSPNDYVSERRIETSKRLLMKSGALVTTIAYDLGFSSSQHFASTFKQFTGITPTRYRQSPEWKYLGPDHILGHPSRPAKKLTAG